jgi:hypothetical protein
MYLGKGGRGIRAGFRVSVSDLMEGEIMLEETHAHLCSHGHSHLQSPNWGWDPW